MKIEDVEVLILETEGEYATSDRPAEVHGNKRTCLVVVSTDTGLRGYSQLESQPHVVAAIVQAPGESGGGMSGLRALAVGQDPLQIEQLWDRLYKGSFIHGRRGAVLQAISGIDIACWDILGQHTGLPVATLLGGKRRDSATAYASTLFRTTPEANCSAAARYREAGYRAVKFGWGRFGESLAKPPFRENLANDVAMVEAVREGLGEESELMIDAGWRRHRTFKDALQMVRAIEPYRPFWVEEPCFPEDYETYRRLSDAVATRIAAGEAEATHWSFRDLLRAGIDVVQPDLSRCGGFTVARRIAYMAEDYNVMVCPHAWGSDILTAATLQFLAFLPRESFVEFNVASDPISRDLVLDPFRLQDGLIHVPDKPGLGIEVNLDTIRDLAIT